MTGCWRRTTATKRRERQDWSHEPGSFNVARVNSLRICERRCLSVLPMETLVVGIENGWYEVTVGKEDGGQDMLDVICRTQKRPKRENSYLLYWIWEPENSQIPRGKKSSGECPQLRLARTALSSRRRDRINASEVMSTLPTL
jgi:hypothetical protein